MRVWCWSPPPRLLPDVLRAELLEITVSTDHPSPLCQHIHAKGKYTTFQTSQVSVICHVGPPWAAPLHCPRLAPRPHDAFCDRPLIQSANDESPTLPRTPALQFMADALIQKSVFGRASARESGNCFSMGKLEPAFSGDVEFTAGLKVCPV